MRSLISLVLVLSLLVSTFTPAAMAQGTPSPPLLQIVAPEEGCTVSVGENLTVMLVAQEGLNISVISVLCDGKGIGMIKDPPYSLVWDTKDVEPGQHVLRAIAYLKSGDKIAAEPVTITFTPGKSTSPQTVEGPQPAIIKDGTPVILATMEQMISGEVQNGSTVRYKVVRDVLGPNGEVVIPYGAMGFGKVTESEHAKAFGKPGKLNFTIESTEAADGTPVPLRATQKSEGKDIRAAVIVGFLFISILAAFIKGKEVTVSEGTLITAYVDHDTAVKKPLPPPSGGVRSDNVERVYIAVDKDYASAGQAVTIRCQVFPPGEAISLRLLVNGQEALKVQQPGDQVVWDTTGLVPGKYELVAEAVFLNGKMIQSSPISFSLR